jgi:hypothetical protein
MGFLDELTDRAEEFGDKAKEGFGATEDKSEEVIENAKDRFNSGDDAATRAEEAVGYSSETAAGIKDAVAGDRTGDSEST